MIKQFLSKRKFNDNCGVHKDHLLKEIGASIYLSEKYDYSYFESITKRNIIDAMHKDSEYTVHREHTNISITNFGDIEGKLTIEIKEPEPYGYDHYIAMGIDEKGILNLFIHYYGDEEDYYFSFKYNDDKNDYDYEIEEISDYKKGDNEEAKNLLLYIKSKYNNLIKEFHSIHQLGCLYNSDLTIIFID